MRELHDEDDAIEHDVHNTAHDNDSPLKGSSSKHWSDNVPKISVQEQVKQKVCSEPLALDRMVHELRQFDRRATDKLHSMQILEAKKRKKSKSQPVTQQQQDGNKKGNTVTELFRACIKFDFSHDKIMKYWPDAVSR